MFNFGLCSNPDYKPNHIVTLPFYKYIPVISDIANYLGVISSDYQTIKKTLQKGDSVSLMLGGVCEMNLTEPNKLTVYVKQRKGGEDENSILPENLCQAAKIRAVIEKPPKYIQFDRKNGQDGQMPCA